MAAITTTAFRGTFKKIRDVSADTSTGATVWVGVPSWAVYAEIDIDVSATGGTTPVLTPVLLSGNALTMDDADAVQLNATFTTPPTGGSRNTIFVGPGVSVADDVALSATGNGQAFVNIPLPSLLGIQFVQDRAEANETYSYTATLKFRR